ncbi:MAG: hypothetical protein F6Q13_01900 [Mycobacterium sp.]|nr:MAG: hypothetical protein F6Q13_01900 [Mycobacterium sp.]
MTQIGLSEYDEPVGVAVDPNTNYVYVADSGTNQVSVFDSTGITNISLPSGSDPGAVTVDPNTDTVYVTDYGTDQVSVINGFTNKVTATISLPSGAEPEDVAGLW